MVMNRSSKLQNQGRDDVLIVGNDCRGYGFLVASPNEEERLLREARNEARQQRIKQARLAFSKKSRENIRKKHEFEEQQRMSAQSLVESQMRARIESTISYGISIYFHKITVE
eukprot:755587-Hanusia_phi.AAC.8